MSLSILQLQTPAVFEPLLHPARYKGAYGGRGSGKSHFFAELLIERSIAAKVDAVCVREIQKSLDQSVKKLLAAKIAGLNAGAYFTVQDAKIKSAHGGLVIFQGMQDHTSDSIKSLEGYDVLWAEEAQSLSQRSLDLMRPTIRKPGSELWFSWNPRHDSDPVDALLRGDKPPPGAVVVQANYGDNPFLPEVLREELEYDRARDPEKYQHVWLGGYVKNSQARVFRNWRVEDFEAPPGTVFRLGADWGFAVDPSVLIRCFIAGRNLYVDHEAYQVGCEIDNLPDHKLGLMVADSGISDGDRQWRGRKVVRNRGALIGLAGEVSEGELFLGWWKRGCLERPPRFANSQALVLSAEGLMCYSANCVGERIAGGVEAIGSGAKAAICTYEALRWTDPVRAVRIVCKHDSGSRAPVRAYRLSAVPILR